MIVVYLLQQIPDLLQLLKRIEILITTGKKILKELMNVIVVHPLLLIHDSQLLLKQIEITIVIVMTLTVDGVVAHLHPK